MKRFLSLLSLVLLTSGLISTPLSFAAISYNGVDNSNDYAYSVIQNVSGTLTEKTSAASNSTTNDVTLYKSTGSELYIGYSDEFDGISASVYTTAAGGAYSVKYWNGSSWTSLVSSTSESISNSTDGTFQVEWDRPSDWATKNILMDLDEDGNADQYTGYYYFAKIVVMSAYSSSPDFSQIGVINYNLKVNIEDEFGNTPSSYSSNYTFNATGADSTVYVSKDDGNGTEYYGFYTPLAGNTYTYSATVAGFVQESGSLDMSHAQSTLNLNLDYTHKLSAESSSTGNQVTITSAYAGTDDTTCTIHSGVAYCAVPTSEDGGTATVSASGYTTKSVSIPNRTSDSDAQASTEVSMSSSSSGSNNPDLTVDDLYLSNDDLVVELSNEGSEDVSSNDTVRLYVYVDGDREASSSITYEYFDAGESTTFTALYNFFDDNETYEVEVCIDPTEEIDESDENNNCRTETLGADTSDEPDLEVTDIYIEDDELYFTVENTGDSDVDSGDSVEIEVSVDGDSQYAKTVTQSSSSDNFLDEGEESTYNAGSILDDEGSSYEVEICVDTEEAVDESSESNNCMSVDEDSIGDGPNNDSDSCGDFNDLSTHWSEEYVCDLYERDVVSGRSDNYFYPNSSTTRAEFLKMVLLDAELDPYSVSSVYYTDVDSNDWFYSYVTYATAMGYVDGYSDGSFGPNEAINRAEALVILMRVADQTDFDFDESDINFSDVERGDWFAYAVVLADEADLVDGYNNGTFGPQNDITRGEAAKILDLAYDQYFN